MVLLLLLKKLIEQEKNERKEQREDNEYILLPNFFNFGYIFASAFIFLCLRVKNSYLSASFPTGKMVNWNSW